MMVTGDTNFGAVSPTRVFGDVGLYRTWFSQMDSLVPERGPTDPDATDAVIPVYMPCANGLVYLFNDLLMSSFATCSASIVLQLSI